MPQPLKANMDIQTYNESYIRNLPDTELIVLFEQVYTELKQRIVKIEPLKNEDTATSFNETQCAHK